MNDTTDNSEGLPASAGSGAGRAVMDAVISGGLMQPVCAHDNNHGIVCVWSSGAEEQLDALVESYVDVVRRKWASDVRWMSAYALLLTEAGLAPSGAELVAAAKRWESLQNDQADAL